MLHQTNEITIFSLAIILDKCESVFPSHFDFILVLFASWHIKTKCYKNELLCNDEKIVCYPENYSKLKFEKETFHAEAPEA